MPAWNYKTLTSRDIISGVLLGLVIVAIGYVLMEQSREVEYVAATPTPLVSPTPEPVHKKVSMIFVGDIMLSRQVGDKITASGDWRYPFLRIGDFLRSADITVANLENPVSDRGVRVGSIYSFRADPRTIVGLTYAGIDIATLANNHIWDYSREAFLDTMMHLKNAGIEYNGAGYTFDEAHRGVTKTVNDTTITFLAYTDLISRQVAATTTTPGVSFLVREQVKADIAAAKLKSDLVVVSYHMGDEYQTSHNASQAIIYKEAIDAGADLIIGHHPHVVQEVEPYKNGWIAYSLGNFIFDQYFSAETMRGLALKVLVTDKKISSVESIPVQISAQSQPYLH